MLWLRRSGSGWQKDAGSRGTATFGDGWKSDDVGIRQIGICCAHCPCSSAWSSAAGMWTEAPFETRAVDMAVKWKLVTVDFEQCWELMVEVG